MTTHVSSLPELETLVVDLFRHMGHTVTSRNYPSHHIADISIAAANGEVWLARCIHTSALAEDDVTSLISLMQGMSLHKAAILTAGSISPDVSNYAKRHHVLPVDGALLFRYLNRGGVLDPPPRSPTATPANDAPQSQIPSPTSQTSSRRLKPPVVAAVMATFAIVGACICIILSPSLLAGPQASPTPTPPCDLAQAVRFDAHVVEVEGSIVEGLFIALSNPNVVPLTEIDQSLQLAREWQELVDKSDKIPDCYDSMLRETLQLTRQAAAHYVDAFAAIRLNDYTSGQRELDLGVDASNSAGEVFMDAICQYDLSATDRPLALACKNWVSP
jgi:hypothetical protein